VDTYSSSSRSDEVQCTVADSRYGDALRYWCIEYVSQFTELGCYLSQETQFVRARELPTAL